MNQNLPQKSKSAVQSYEGRPVGCPPDPDLSAMTKEELDQRRDTVGRLRELMKKAEKGDKKVLPEIREILEESSELPWRFANLAGLAERFFIDRLSKDKDLATKEVMERQLAAMREEIAGENPSTLQRLLAEWAVASWLLPRSRSTQRADPTRTAVLRYFRRRE